jgi:hypothetical protein
MQYPQHNRNIVSAFETLSVYLKHVGPHAIHSPLGTPSVYRPEQDKMLTSQQWTFLKRQEYSVLADQRGHGAQRVGRLPDNALEGVRRVEGHHRQLGRVQASCETEGGEET